MLRQSLSPTVERALVASCFVAVLWLALWAYKDWLQGNLWCEVDEVRLTPPVFLVDLQSACEAELGLLPDVGPELARRIVAARNQGMVFRSAADLRSVRGIGPKRQQAIAPFLARLSSDNGDKIPADSQMANRQTELPAHWVAIPAP